MRARGSAQDADDAAWELPPRQTVPSVQRRRVRMRRVLQLLAVAIMATVLLLIAPKEDQNALRSHTSFSAESAVVVSRKTERDFSGAPPLGQLGSQEVELWGESSSETRKEIAKWRNEAILGERSRIGLKRNPASIVARPSYVRSVESLFGAQNCVDLSARELVHKGHPVATLCCRRARREGFQERKGPELRSALPGSVRDSLLGSRASSKKVEQKSSNATYFCLPGLVVMGAQKGGTTAMHSFLMLHPQMQPSLKKELHLFDNDRGFVRFHRHLVMNFGVQENERPGFRVPFETTPSYLAAPLTCERISTWLPPSTVFVIILRDPVKRFWSEYQMKYRRIINQDLLISSIMRNSDRLSQCWEKIDLKDKQSVSAHTSSCFSELDKILQGSRPKRRMIRSRFRDSKRRWNLHEECILGKFFDDIPIEQHRSCFKRLGFINEVLPDLSTVLAKESELNEECRAKRFHPSRGKDEQPIRSVMNSGRRFEIEACRQELAQSVCNQCTEDPSANCLEQCEAQKKDLSVKEVQRIDKQGHAVENPVSIASFKIGCQLHRHESYPPRKLTAIKACQDEICQCYPNARNYADISKNFLWRGMYYPQLVHCMKYIPREQVFIVENEEMRKDPKTVIGGFLKMKGLDIPDYGGPGFSYADAEKAFSEMYPDFEEVTGWSADGSSTKKIPDHVELQLRHFYAEPNELLFDFLGKRFDHWL